jgi:hypothetical protein
MKNAGLLLILVAGCGNGIPNNNGSDGSSPDLFNPLPICPQGAAEMMPCTKGSPQCQVPGASSEGSPLTCFCPCSDNCYWETDQISASCDGGQPSDLAPMGDIGPLPTDDGGFTCGQACNPATQYCFLPNDGDGGLGPGLCSDLPQGCNACPCLQAEHQCVTTCVVQDGLIYLICPKL